MMVLRRDIDDEGMPNEALVMALGTFFLFAVMDTTAKVLVLAGLAPVFVVWCRFTSQAVLFFVIRRGWSNADLYASRNHVLQALRGMMLPVATLLNFAALQTLPLNVTATIFLASPMLVTALSGPMLGEWAGLRRWAAIVIGFIGVLIVVRPGTEVFTWPVLWSVGCMAAYSLYSVLTRKLAATETRDSLVFYSCIFGAVLLAPIAVGKMSLPDNVLFAPLLVLIGVFGMTGHFLLIKASTIASAGKVAPFVYTQLLWMTLFGFILFGEVPDLWTAVGATIVCASGLYILMRERALRKRGTETL